MGSPGGISGGNPSANAGGARDPGSLGREDPPENAWVLEQSAEVCASPH